MDKLTIKEYTIETSTINGNIIGYINNRRGIDIIGIYYIFDEISKIFTDISPDLAIDCLIIKNDDGSFKTAMELLTCKQSEVTFTDIKLIKDDILYEYYPDVEECLMKRMFGNGDNANILSIFYSRDVKLFYGNMIINDIEDNDIIYVYYNNDRYKCISFDNIDKYTNYNKKDYDIITSDAIDNTYIYIPAKGMSISHKDYTYNNKSPNNNVIDDNIKDEHNEIDNKEYDDNIYDNYIDDCDGDVVLENQILKEKLNELLTKYKNLKELYRKKINDAIDKL